MNAISILFIIALILTALFGNLLTGGSDELPISEFVDKFESGAYERVEIRDQKVKGILKGGSAELGTQQIDTAILPVQDRLSDIGLLGARDNDTIVEIADTRAMHFWAEMAPTILGLILFIGLGIFLLSRMMQ